MLNAFDRTLAPLPRGKLSSPISFYLLFMKFFFNQATSPSSFLPTFSKVFFFFQSHFMLVVDIISTKAPGVIAIGAHFC